MFKKYIGSFYTVVQQYILAMFLGQHIVAPADCFVTLQSSLVCERAAAQLASP